MANNFAYHLKSQRKLDKKVEVIHQSGKTYFKSFEKPHNFYRAVSKFYYTWHLNPHSNLIHKLVLSAFIVLSLFTSYYIVNPFHTLRTKAAGTNYYVDAASSCVSSCGSQAQPHKTIQAAANVASAGDTVYVAGGVYNERVTISADGTALNPIKFIKSGVNRPQISRGIVVAGDYIEFSEFKPWPMYSGIGSETAAVQVTGNHNNIHHFDIPTGSVGGSAIVINEQGSATNNMVSNFEITDINGVCGAYGPETSYNIIKDGYCHGFGDNVAIGNLDGSNNTLENIEITGEGTAHNTSGWSAGANADADGIHPLGDNNVIRGVKIHHLWATPLASDAHTDSIQFWNHCGNLLVENSIFGSYASAPADSAAPGSSDPANAVLMMSGQQSGSSITFRNNVVLSTSGGAGYWAQFNESGAYDVQMDFYNNTIWSDTNFMSKPHMVGSFRNNILRSDYHGYTGWVPLDSVIFSNNMFINSTYARGTNNIIGYPMFVNGDITATTNYGVNADFHLQFGSPAINVGVSTATDSKVPLTDKDGKSRYGATDMGAYEYTAKRHYVSTIGSAAWSACVDIATPCSLATAISNYAAGDEIQLRAGTYSTRYTFARSGSATEHVTFKPYSGETVIFSQGFVISGDYVDFVGGGDYKTPATLGFVVTPGSTTISNTASGPVGQVRIEGSHNTISGIHVHGGTGTAYSSAFSTTTTNTQTGNTITNFVIGTPTTDTGSPYWNGMSVKRDGIFIGRHTSDTTITDGELTGFGGTAGVTTNDGAFGTGSGVLMEDLYIHGPAGWNMDDNVSDGDGFRACMPNVTARRLVIDVWQEFDHLGTGLKHTDAFMTYTGSSSPQGPDNLLIEDSFMGSMNTTHSWDSTHSLGLGSSNGNTDGRTRQHTIRNNVIMMAEPPGDPMVHGVYSYSGGDGLTVNYINNYFKGGSPSLPGTTIFKNNIIEWPNNRSLEYGGRNFGDSSNNAFVGYSSLPVWASGQAGSFVTANPMFVNSDLSSATRYGLDANFLPAAGSPLINAGVLNTGVSGTDKAGLARVGFPDIGPFEYQGAVPVTYTVSYNGNGNTGGSAPTDGTPHASGATVTVLGNTGSLVKTGYTFAGWNTAANVTGTDRAAGSTFAMPAANTTLYAKWTINTYSLTTAVSPVGVGTISGVTNPYNYNTNASITAIATNPRYQFSSWSGDCVGTNVATLVAMTASKSCTANFSTVPVSIVNSTFSASVNPVTVPGSTNLTLTLKDTSGNNVSGHTIQFSTDQTGLDVLSPSTATTNASGQAIVNVSAVLAHSSTVTAYDQTEGLTVKTRALTFSTPPPTPDTTNPTVSLTAPINGATISGTSVILSATASDNVAVSSVEFYHQNWLMESTLICTTSVSPYICTWDTTEVSNGDLVLVARAIDTSGNDTWSTGRSVTITNVAPVPVSTVSAGTPSKPLLMAVSTNRVTLDIVLKDASNNNLSGRTVTVTGQRAGDTVTPSAAATDSSGKITYTITSTSIGTINLTFTSEGVSTPVSITVVRPGNINNSGTVNYVDAGIFMARWGKTTFSDDFDRLSDIYTDGKIDYRDAGIFMANWGS